MTATNVAPLRAATPVTRRARRLRDDRRLGRRRARACSTWAAATARCSPILAAQRRASGYGIEIDDAGVLASVRNGINVIQSDLERGLAGFDDAAFDVVILSQTLQAMRRIEAIVAEMLRVGPRGDRHVPEFRPLVAPAADPARAHAGVAVAAVPVVRHAEHPPVHRRRFRRVPRRARAIACSIASCSPSGRPVRVRAEPDRRARDLPVPPAMSARRCAAASRRSSSAAKGNVARGALQPADADLRLHRLLVGTAAVPADQPAAGVAAHRRRRPEDDRLLRADPASVHVEVPVVAAARSLCAAAARPPPRLDARHAGRAARVDPAVRRAASASRTSGRSSRCRRSSRSSRRARTSCSTRSAARSCPTPSSASARRSTSTRTGSRASCRARWR